MAPSFSILLTQAPLSNDAHEQTNWGLRRRSMQCAEAQRAQWACLVQPEANGKRAQCLTIAPWDGRTLISSARALCSALCRLQQLHAMALVASLSGGGWAAVAAALLGAASLAASRFGQPRSRPAAPCPAAPSSEQAVLPKEAGGGGVAVTAAAAVPRRATPFPPLLGASSREEEIRMLRQKAAVAEESARCWGEQGGGVGWGVCHLPQLASSPG